MSARRSRPDVKALRARLEAEAARLREALGRAGRLTGEARERAGGKAPCAFLDATGDAAVAADPDLRAAERRAEELRRVEEALVRFDADPEAFGSCALCGEAIDLDRLMLVPHASRCRGCADQP